MGGQSQYNLYNQQQQQNDYGSQMNLNQNQQYGSQMNFNQNQQPQQNSYGQPPMNAVYGSQMNMNQNQNQNQEQQQNDNDYKQQQQQQQGGGGMSGGVVLQNGGSSKSKYFDQQTQNEFTMKVRQRMFQILGNNRFDASVHHLTAAINAASDECLKAMKKPNYKFISHTLLVPLNGGYNKGDSKFWKVKTDVCMQVRVDTQFITAILEAYAIGM